MPPEIRLLRELVAHPSVSGTEEALGAFVEDAVRGWGLDVRRDGSGLRVEIGGAERGPTLALVSHLDTVPPGEGWTRDPFDPGAEGGRIHGRGSGDAKASVASMLYAARDLAERGGPARGRLLVLLGYGEETRDTTMPRLLGSCGPIHAAVIGEPTGLDFAVAQRGLMMVELIARGDQRHPGRTGDDGAGDNAILALASDLVRLERLFRDRPDPTLGHPSVTPTRLEAGVGRNVTPPRAMALLDLRSTPAWTHEELASGLRAALDGEVVVTSDRLVPCRTPEGSGLLRAALGVRPGARPFGSPTCSDWVFLGGRDAFKCGPGASARSHTADEWVAADEVREAREFYAALAEAYLR